MITSYREWLRAVRETPWWTREREEEEEKTGARIRDHQTSCEMP